MKNKNFAIIFFSVLGMLSLVIAGCDNSAAEKQSDVSTIDPAEKLEMLRKIEQLDKMDFQGELTQLNACLKKYDLSCADNHLKRAGMFISDVGDKKQIAVAAASIGGTRFLVKARECINQDSFSCAKTNIEQAKSVNGNVVMATLLKKEESSYETSYANYQAKQAEKERRRKAQQRRAREEEQYRYSAKQSKRSLMDSTTFSINCVNRLCPSSRRCEDFCGLAAAAWANNDEKDALGWLCEIIAPDDNYGCNRYNSLQDILARYRLEP